MMVVMMMVVMVVTPVPMVVVVVVMIIAMVVVMVMHSGHLHRMIGALHLAVGRALGRIDKLQRRERVRDRLKQLGVGLRIRDHRRVDGRGIGLSRIQ